MKTDHMKLIMESTKVLEDYIKSQSIQTELTEAIQIILDECEKIYHISEHKKICKNCGKPFIAYTTHSIYCDRQAPQDTTKTCRIYGKEETWNKKIKDENNWYSLYRKVYQSLQVKAKRNPNNIQFKQNYDNFRIKANKWKRAVKEGTKTETEFMAWLQNFRNKK